MFCLCFSIFLNNVIDDMICLVNTDSILTLDYGNVENIHFLGPIGSYTQIEFQIPALIFQGKP